MATNWITPTIFSQYAEPEAEQIHISWDDTNDFSPLLNIDSGSVGTTGTLYHIARSPKTDLTTKTYYLKLQGFNFTNLPETVSGIECKISADRRGRITDETIQLCLNDELIGENRATLNLDPIKIYGGNTDLWSTENLSMSNIQDPQFGVVIRFQSHPSFPHRDGAHINAVELRIH
jgi:hypothetical protein